ncbi:MAG: squalene/phytoene synthase family protein [Aquabacterium sp.]|uniref:squalene/phytoene synthase family protein n=1 Tax=Aquabacterium sp. TaxID=1872578 RepID=UPI0025C1D014|nr:squalene/phytoene synthase family protein [Aquabacterium sp.]MBI5925845.1 squalene/phytoene synthase family protein [Aquabacterium sp.]
MNSSTPHSPADVFPRAGSSLYYALAAASASQRPALLYWVQWWHETAQIPFKIQDPGVAETKLRWWLQELNDAAQGQAHHPLLKGLTDASRVSAPAQVPAWPLWSSQIEGLITLINQTRWLDDASLQRHMRQTTGAAAEGAACLLGATSEAARQAAHQLGWGLRQAHQLTRLGQDARSGWIQVAIDVLQAHDVRAHQLSKPDAASPAEGWPRLLTHLHGQASAHLHQGLTACRALPSAERAALKPLLVLCHIYLHLIDQVARQGDRVLHERIVLTPLRKWWIAQRVRWGLLR